VKINLGLEILNHSSSSNSQKNNVVIGKETDYFENSIPLDNQNEISILPCNKIDQITTIQKPFIKRVLLDNLHY